MSKKTILITGSEGFVGSYLQKVLESKGYNIITTDRINKKNNSTYININLDSKEINKLTGWLRGKNIDLIIHLAAAKGDFMLSPSDFYRDNVTATRNLITLSKELNIQNILHYSTVSVYGYNNKRKDEKAKLKPQNPYGLTKLESENLLVSWQKKTKSNLTILRPSVIYGENNFANMYNLLSLLSKRFPITIGNGNYVKSMIAIENLIDITIFLIEKMKGIQIYNCTDEPYPTLRECMEYISEIDGFRTPIIKLPIYLSLILATPIEVMSFLIRKDLKVTRERIYKYSMATDYRSELIRSMGYKQRFSTKERLQNMAKWYKKIN